MNITRKPITDDEFDDAVQSLAEQAGVTALLSISGVWEEVSEYFNNDAIDLAYERRGDLEETDQ